MTNIMALYPTPTHKTDDVLPCCIWNPQAPLQPSVSSSQINQLQSAQSAIPYALASLIWKFHFVVSHLETFHLESGK